MNQAKDILENFEKKGWLTWELCQCCLRSQSWQPQATPLCDQHKQGGDICDMSGDYLWQDGNICDMGGDYVEESQPVGHAFAQTIIERGVLIQKTGDKSYNFLENKLSPQNK